MRRPTAGAALAALVLAAVSVTAAVVAGQASDGAIVLAAASLTEVLPRIDPDARSSFAGSNQLSQQIRLGAPFDVFLSASPVYTQELARDGFVRRPVAFATNSLVLIVPRSNPRRIRSVEDLAERRQLRLVVAGQQVPIGLYTREVLRRLGLLRVLDRAVSHEPDVKGIVGKVALGEADGGFVYLTDVRPVRREVRVIPLPADAQPTVTYEAAIAARPESSERARSFLSRLRSPGARQALREAGFGVP